MSSDKSRRARSARGSAFGKRPDARAGRRRAPTDVVRVGVIGYGYWGPNIVRNFHGARELRGRGGLRQEPGALQRARSAPIPACT